MKYKCASLAYSAVNNIKFRGNKPFNTDRFFSLPNMLRQIFDRGRNVGIKAKSVRIFSAGLRGGSNICLDLGRKLAQTLID